MDKCECASCVTVRNFNQANLRIAELEADLTLLRGSYESCVNANTEQWNKTQAAEAEAAELKERLDDALREAFDVRHIGADETMRLEIAELKRQLEEARDASAALAATRARLAEAHTVLEEIVTDDELIDLMREPDTGRHGSTLGRALAALDRAADPAPPKDGQMHARTCPMTPFGRMGGDIITGPCNCGVVEAVLQARAADPAPQPPAAPPPSDDEEAKRAKNFAEYYGLHAAPPIPPSDTGEAGRPVDWRFRALDAEVRLERALKERDEALAREKRWKMMSSEEVHRIVAERDALRAEVAALKGRLGKAVTALQAEYDGRASITGEKGETP